MSVLRCWQGRRTRGHHVPDLGQLSGPDVQSDGSVLWRVDEPCVTQDQTPYEDIEVRPGDLVVIDAGGCVNTRGLGKTTKRFVDPLGDNADLLYHGTVHVPGVHRGMVRLIDAIGAPLWIPSTYAGGDTVILGYEDDDYENPQPNDYNDLDSGTDDQCDKQSAAWVTFRVKPLQFRRAQRRLLDLRDAQGPAPRPDVDFTDWTLALTGGLTFEPKHFQTGPPQAGPYAPFEWMQVTDPNDNMDTNPQSCAGMALLPQLTGADDPMTHAFGLDWECWIALDPGFEGLLALANRGSVEDGQPNDFRAAAIRGHEANLFCVLGHPPGSSVELVVLDETFVHEDLHQAIPVPAAASRDYRYAVGDFDGDGITDLFCIRTADTQFGHVEITVFGGASGFQRKLFHTAIGILEQDAGDYEFALADFDHDGDADLFCIRHANTPTGFVTVFVNSGRGHMLQFVYGGPTPIRCDDAGDYSFCVADLDCDGVPDLICVRRAHTRSGATEVTVLSGAEKFKAPLRLPGNQDFLDLPIALPAAEASDYSFAIADYDGDGTPDLICIRRANTARGMVEVTVLGGASRFHDVILDQAPTLLSAADTADNAYLVADLRRSEAAGVLGVEMEAQLIPRRFQPSHGDRVALGGRWIIDTGHLEPAPTPEQPYRQGFHTEVHPPQWVATAHAEDQTTRSTLVGRPFLGGQTFAPDDATLWTHLVNEFEKAVSFTSERLEAHPQLEPKPFPLPEARWTYYLRPAIDRPSDTSELMVRASILRRQGVTVVVEEYPHDAVQVTVRVDTVRYQQWTLINMFGVPILPEVPYALLIKDLVALFEEQDETIKAVEGLLGSAGLAQDAIVAVLSFALGTDLIALDHLLGKDLASVIAKGISMTRYKLPSPPEMPDPKELPARQAEGEQWQEDDHQPWPVLGLIDVYWQ